MNTCHSYSRSDGGKIGLYFSILYLIAEYMRPQQMYDAFSDAPLAEIASIGLLFSLIFENRPVRNSNIVNVIIIAFLFWVYVSYTFSFNQTLAWNALLDVSKMVAIYYLLINTINKEKHLYIFIAVLVALHLKLTQALIRTFIGNGFDIGVSGLYAGAGFFLNPGDMGTALVTVFGISYYMGKVDSGYLIKSFNLKWFFKAAAFSIPIALLTTNSRGPVLAFVVCLIVIWIKSRNKASGLVVLAMSVSLLILLNPSWERFKSTGTEEDTTGRSRLLLWQAGVQMANERPLTGVGPMNFVYVNMNIYNSDLNFVQHNVFIQALSELGYPGLALYILLMVLCFYNCRNIRSAMKKQKLDSPFLHELSNGLDVSLVGFAVSALFVSVLYYPFMWVILVINVALFDAVRQALKKQAPVEDDIRQIRL